MFIYLDTAQCSVIDIQIQLVILHPPNQQG